MGRNATRIRPRGVFQGLVRSKGGLAGGLPDSLEWARRTIEGTENGRKRQQSNPSRQFGA